LKPVESKVNLFNRQRKLPVDLDSVRQFLESVVECLGLNSGLSVVLVSDAAMRRYNATYAGRDRPTDVLSFPAGDTAGDEPYLGDIIISVETADAQRSASLDDEVKVLRLHGIPPAFRALVDNETVDRGARTDSRAIESVPLTPGTQ